MQKSIIIVNPTSRTTPRRERLQAAADSMRVHGWEVEIAHTEGPGHATGLARAAVEAGLPAVFACGGDGTINEVVNGLAGSSTALAVMRGGMGNVFAKEIGLNRNPMASIRVLIDGERRRFDLGTANGRYFLLMAGVGFDAAVVKSVPSSQKRLFGSASYILHAFMRLPGYEPSPASITLDEGDWQGELFWALIGNTRSYGGVLDVSSQALVDDGLLDAYVFSGRGAGKVAAAAAAVFTGKHHESEGITYRRIRSASVETPGLPVQADGEYFGETPVRFGVAPAAVDILLPRGKAAKLFGPAT